MNKAKKKKLEKKTGVKICIFGSEQFGPERSISHYSGYRDLFLIEPIVNFMEPFSCGTHSQNSFPESI